MNFSEHKTLNRVRTDVRLLIQRTAHLRNGVVGIGTDEPNRSYDQHKDDSEHYSIFSDVLAFIRPE